MSTPKTPIALRWIDTGEGHLELLDQTLLPVRQEWLACHDVDRVVEAIKMLRVRGAPAIGVAGAYGVAVAAIEAMHRSLPPAAARAHVLARADILAEARPTAVNLRWAVERTVATLRRLPADAPAAAVREAALAEARTIHDEDRRLCAAIGRHGARALAAALTSGSGTSAGVLGVLTHCNAGALATGGDGTALAAITAAWDEGQRFEVFADETRPLFQGSRLTAWELVQRGIPVTVLVDSAAGHLLRTGRIAACIVGADRITAGGDVANKIGTYSLAVLAAAHGVPFFVAAPSSTFDLSIDEGDRIPIEQRTAEEVTHPLGTRAAPDGARAYNPAFDVTPARLVRAIITEHGAIEPVNRERIAAVLRDAT
jgi:methylthioribose-1-phosphate isomerase